MVFANNNGKYINPYPAQIDSDLAFTARIESGQPALACSLTRLSILLLDQIQVLNLISLKNDNGQCQK